MAKINFSWIKDRILLLVIGLYLILNSGFMQIRFPLSQSKGVPIGEIVLLFALLTIDYSKLILRFSKAFFVFPLFIWWGFSLSQALVGFFDYGMWAFRDASHFIESIFVIVGFSFASRPDNLRVFKNWLSNLAILISIYALGYPFQEILREISPTIQAAGGYASSLFFMYSNTGGMLLWVAAYLIIYRNKRNAISLISLFLAGFMLFYSAFLFQARTIYLQIFALFILLFLCRRITANEIITGIGISIALLVALSVFEIKLPGRLQQNVSPRFFYDHFISLFGIATDGLFGAAGGVTQRLEWWLKLYRQWTSSLGTWLLGLGYGFPLVAWVTENGVPVREPHNSFISVIARTGMIGFVSFFWVQIILLRTWKRAYKICKLIKWTFGKKYLLALMAFFIFVWVLALGEDAFEKPFWAIPYYFFWGYVLALYDRLRRGWKPDALAAMAADDQAGV